MTLGEQFLSGFIGIHVRLLEHGVDIRVGVVSDNLLDGLDSLPDAQGDKLTSAVDPRAQDHLYRIGGKGKSRRAAAGAKP